MWGNSEHSVIILMTLHRKAQWLFMPHIIKNVIWSGDNF